MAGERWDAGWSEPAAPGAPPVKGEGGWAQSGQGAYGPGPSGEGQPAQPGWDPSGQGHPGWAQPGQPAQPGWDPSGQGQWGQDAPGPWGQPGHSPAPPGRRGPHPALLVGLALALFLVVGIAAAVILTAGGEDDGGSSASSSEAAELAPASDVELVPYAHPDGTYSLSTPAGWVSSPIEGDVAGLGDELFAGDPQLAEAFQMVANSLPRNIVFVSMDRDDMTARRFTTNLTVARVSDVPVGDLDELEGVLRREVQAFAGAEVTSESRVETPAGEAIRMEYDIGSMPGVSGIQYGLLVDGEVWSFAYSSDDLPDDAGVADAIAATFDLS